jgi:hypothetical protein
MIRRLNCIRKRTSEGGRRQFALVGPVFEDAVDEQGPVDVLPVALVGGCHCGWVGRARG